MKGFIPNLQQDNIETNSKSSSSFIELGVLQQEHEEDCKCDECISLRREVKIK